MTKTTSRESRELQRRIKVKEAEFAAAEEAGGTARELNAIYKELKELRLQLDLMKPELSQVVEKK